MGPTNGETFCFFNNPPSGTGFFTIFVCHLRWQIRYLKAEERDGHKYE